MRFNKQEKDIILHNRHDYPALADLIERQNAWDFQNEPMA